MEEIPGRHVVKLPMKPIRKLVTLPPDLADRFEKFRTSIGTPSESEALKTLIEDGLKMRDTPEDLLERCEMLTSRGRSIGDIINLVTKDHPLVQSSVLDQESLIVYLKQSDSEAAQERLRLLRNQSVWRWEAQTGYNGDWEKIKQPKVSALIEKSCPETDLDDKIPF